MDKRIKSKKIISACKCCGQVKEDHFSNGFCLPCNRIEQLLKLYANNKEKLREVIQREEDLLSIKKLILAGVHPITNERLYQLKIFHCFKSGEYVGEFKGFNKKDVFLKIPGIQRIRNQKAWDALNNEYVLISAKI